MAGLVPAAVERDVAEAADVAPEALVFTPAAGQPLSTLWQEGSLGQRLPHQEEGGAGPLGPCGPRRGGHPDACHRCGLGGGQFPSAAAATLHQVAAASTRGAP
jgi:hypothetical protein